MVWLRWVILSVSLLVVAGPAAAQRFHYVQPPGTASAVTPDGTREAPWVGLNDALAAAEGGDILLLEDGDYGGASVYGATFDAPVLIQSLAGKGAHFDFLVIHGGSRNLTFRNLSVWEKTKPQDRHRHLIVANPDTQWIRMEGLDVRGRADAERYLDWSADGWADAKGGIFVRGDDSAVTDCTLRGVDFGIEITGDRSEAVRNIIDGFAGDGVRAIGDHSLVAGNTIMNNVAVNGNHDDGIQSWATGETVRGLVIEGNRILEWTGPEAHPLRGPLQGIGLFDGFFDGLVIRNNLVVVSAWHGISVYGGRGVDIVNNTLVAREAEGRSRPWLGLFAHKNGTESRDVRIANNVAQSFRARPNPVMNVVYSQNFRLIAPELSFADPARGDYRPAAGSALVDAGDVLLAPERDIEGVVRVQHGAPDIGAFELVKGYE